MQINNNPALTALISSFDQLNIKEGRRYLIEIVEVDSNNKGLIILNGKRINVKFETGVQIGEKFWVTGTIKNNKIVLKREFGEIFRPGLETKQDINLDRGINNTNSEISKYLIDFIHQTTSMNNLLNSKNSQFSNLISFLWAIIPKWSELKKCKDNFLNDYYKNLGIEMEKSMYEYFFQSRDKDDFTNESAKFQLLSLLTQKQNSLEQAEKEMLAKLLNEITGQQLWIQSGNKENSYILLHFPLQDNGTLYYCKMAIEWKRKGHKNDDFDFCHLAIKIDTENLGVFGVDLLIYKNSINIKLLNDKLADRLLTNIDNLQYQLEEVFKNLGYNLNSFSVDIFSNFTQFEKFISGNSMAGVDIKL